MTIATSGAAEMIAACRRVGKFKRSNRNHQHQSQNKYVKGQKSQIPVPSDRQVKNIEHVGCDQSSLNPNSGN